MRWHGLLGLLALVLTACTTMSPMEMPESNPALGPLVAEEIPEAGSLLPEEPPPAGAAREFSTDFSKHSVPYGEILSGGPPKDGIPAVDEPRFVTVQEANEWLEPQEPVILVQAGGDARAYPIQILTWHEIVNDAIGGMPVTVTFCPLCNSGVAFRRTFEGQVLDFGTTGRLRFSNLIMYDRQTETWWQQATGEAIAGELTGSRLEFAPASMIAWADFKDAHPDGTVLSRDTGFSRSYGRNPYGGYDDVNESPFLYDGPETPGMLPAMARVGTIELNGDAVAYPYDTLAMVRAVNDTVGGLPIVVLWAPGTASALDADSVAGGDDVGAVAMFSRELDGELLSFVFDGERIVDEQTGSEWNVLGSAVSGPTAGSELTPVVSINHFWFSWAAFRPETPVYQVDIPSYQTPAPAPAAETSDLVADFEIAVYQGQDVLGGQSVRFSELFAQGKPVVLSFWAGLCPICRTEMPELEEVYSEYGGRILIVGLDVGPFVGLGSAEDALALLEELDITYPAGTTSDAMILRDYMVLGTPATVFLLPNGEVLQQWNGLLAGQQLRDNIDALVEASGNR